MKTLLMSLILLASFNSMANQRTTEGTALVTSGPFMLSHTSTTGHKIRKMEAVAVINDAQEAMQSGKISVLLGMKINETMNANLELSEVEALELVIESAESILK